VTNDWPEDAFPVGKLGFPMPAWDKLAKEVESRHAPEELDGVWSGIARHWMERIRAKLPDGYLIRESPKFMLLSRADETRAAEVLRFLEEVDVTIRDAIPALLPETRYGKCPVLVFSNDQLFYEYVSEYLSEDGEFGFMGGVFLNCGYGHFAMPSSDLAQYAAVFSHELCHSYLSHLALPPWLDEAITAGVEDSVAGTSRYSLDAYTIRRHQEFWTEDSIPEFWSGDSFHRPDEGKELSYHLSKFILRLLYSGGNTPREAMEEFFLAARREDAGQAAALEVLGISLGDCVASLLGEGNWVPALRGELSRRVEGS